MKDKDYHFVNGQRGIRITANGMYAPWPIPAAKFLIQNKDWPALRVLTCLITYLGYGRSSNVAYPSIATICKESGQGKAKVQEGIKSLIKYGFILKHKKPAGRFKRNEYEILDTCYQQRKITKIEKTPDEVLEEFPKVPSTLEDFIKHPYNPPNEFADPWLRGNV